MKISKLGVRGEGGSHLCEKKTRSLLRINRANGERFEILRFPYTKK